METLIGIKSVSGGEKDSADTPKTIHRTATTTSGSHPPKKRGRGAPLGNVNALKTGRHTAKGRAIRKETWEFTSGIADLLRRIEVLYGFGPTRRRIRKQDWPVMPEHLRRKLREKARK